MVLAQIALPRTKTSDRMFAECVTVECCDCRAVLEEMHGAVAEEEDHDGWWREQFKKARADVTAGHHLHVQR